MGRLLPTSLALAALALAANPAQAGIPHSIAKRVWATINICDTPAHPQTVGVRVNMSSTSRRDVLLARYRLEYWSPGDNAWLPVRSGADSGWIRIGKGRFRALQRGYSFVGISRPSQGVFSLRGKVDFQWRRDGRLRWSLTRKTRSKLPAKGSDPPGYSEGICNIAADGPRRPDPDPPPVDDG